MDGRVNGVPADLVGGVPRPGHDRLAMSPEEMGSRLLYRDGLMLIVDKPAGLAVHRGPKGGPSLEDAFDALRFGLPRRPALAHRLDKETSGCLVLGRHRKALADLSNLFRHGKIGKTYWAVVEGGPQADEGRIDLPLGRLDDKIGWWMKHDPDGLPSATTWKVMGRCQIVPANTGGAVGSAHPSGVPSPACGGGTGRGNDTDAEFSPLPNPPPQAGEGAGPSNGRTTNQLTWLALEPLTGRTHQLRVHCAETGFPILGDDIYGNAPRRGGPGLHLHAREIVVPLYRNRPPVRVTAPVPPHMKERLKACGWDGADEAATTTPSRSIPASC
jgi:tRNA pseudouridine32 synthase/23S rRNA pseudouridine746 synthase